MGVEHSFHYIGERERERERERETERDRERQRETVGEEGVRVEKECE